MHSARQRRFERTRVATAAALLPLVVACATPAFAQDGAAAGGARAYAIVPSVGLRQTLTDNVRLTSTNREAAAVTEATAGVRATRYGGRFNGFLDYALTGRVQTQGSPQDDVSQALNAFANAELIDQWMFVDVRGVIAQQAISAFGTQSLDSSVSNPNRTETRSFSVSPYWVGSLAGAADYEVRLDHSATDTSSGAASDAATTTALARIGGGNPLGFGWSADGTHVTSDYTAGRRTKDQRLRGILTYAVTPQFNAGVIVGHEENNYESVEMRGHETGGVQFNWRPSERTTLTGNYESRFFGHSHALSFVHRTGRTIWTFTDSRNISTNASQAGTAALGSAYDLFFQQFASQEPDPIKRDLLVRQFLQTNGIAPNAVIVGGVLSSAATVQRLQALSVGLRGVRTTITFHLTQSSSGRLDNIVTAVDDLSNSSQVRQRGLHVDVSHRLTPLSSISFIVSTQRTQGDLASQESTLNSLSTTWSTRTGPRSTLSAGARWVDFDSTTQPYVERALFANLRLQF